MTPAAPLLCLYAGFPHQTTGLAPADLVAAASQLSGHAAATVASALPAMDLSDLAEQGLTKVIRATLSPGIELTCMNRHNTATG